MLRGLFFKSTAIKEIKDLIRVYKLQVEAARTDYVKELK